jgi:hypothetical protein
MPPEGHRGPVVLLVDPSEKSPMAATLHATRAVAKLRERRPDLVSGAEVPLGRFDHGADFADLAARGAL